MCAERDGSESRRGAVRADVALAFRALRTPPLSRQLADIVADTAEAMSSVTVERKRAAHLPVTGDTTRLDHVVQRCRRQRAILSAIVRRATRAPFDAGADLPGVIAEFRTVVCALLDSAAVQEPWHAMVLAEVSTACLIEFYSRSHVGRLTLSDDVMRREAEQQLSRADDDADGS